MGWDVKATADQALAAIDQVQVPTGAQVAEGAQQVGQQVGATAQQVGAAIAANPGSFISYTLAAIILMSLAGLLWRIKDRIGKVLEETMFENWRLGLLGTTGIVLSLASGYTTWDGMRNFTGEAVLSLMVTFGIQGVMLIVAWLIGESFAIGMNQTAVKRTDAQGRTVGAHGMPLWAANLLGAAVGIALFIAITALFVAPSSQPAASAWSWNTISNKLLIIVTSMLGVAFVVLYAASDLVKPYIQSGRVIIKNSVLWVMFLACMGTSVFFSFDSLFSAIFPQSERVRAAELRAQNQVAGILADIEQKTLASRLEEAQALFDTQGWKAYETQLSLLHERSLIAGTAVEAYYNNQLEERNRAIKQQQERMSTAQGGQAGLAGRKIALAEELSRIKGDRPTLAAEYAQKKVDLETKNKEVDAKRVEALAEAGGVEGSGKEGKGPLYRQRMDELSKLQAAVKIGEERLNDAKKRLTTVETRIAVIEREQATLDGDLAKLKGEADTAEQRIKLTQEQLPSDGGGRIDPARIAPAFEAARAEFRQDPTQEHLAQVQKLCSQIHTAMSATPATKKDVAGIDCDPKQAAEAAAAVFALNAGTDIFNKACKGGEKLNTYTSTDALFGFARKCLADSGLPSKETDALRTKINFIELNRDDKAHRFVVTWNAFQDGNRLAYLALAIAIAIDSLVFMSGLFGANAVRSPLSDVPSTKARSAQQLESTINAALGKMPYDTASLVLNAMRPRTNTDGFSAEVSLEGVDKPTADRIRVVLTAGADIHAVEEISRSPERYRVRSELREYLSSVCDRHLKSDKSLHQRARLEHVIASALKPHIQEHADIVIHHMKPTHTREGYTSFVTVNIADEYEAKIVRRVINAGSTLKAITPEDKDPPQFYYVRPDLYEALLMLSAHSPRSPGFEADRNRYFGQLAARAAQPGIGYGGPVHGGALDQQVPQVQAAPPQKSLGAPGAAERGEKFDLPAFLSNAGNAGESEQERENAYISALIAALGVRPEAYTGMSGDAFAAATVAGDYLADLRRDNKDLDDSFIQRDEQAIDRVDRAVSKAQQSLRADDTHSQQMLKSAYQDIQQNWSVLMMMPGGPYEQLIVEMIQTLEPASAEDKLSPREGVLLGAAKHLRTAMFNNPRNSANAWKQLGNAIQETGVQNHASLPQANGKPMLQ